MRRGLHQSVPVEAAATVRLLHRRRGWAWTGAGGLIAFIVYGIVGSVVFPGNTGTGTDLSAALTIVLLVAGIAGVVIAVIETVRLKRLGTSAAGLVVHHPVHAHPFRYPPKHWPSWLIMWLVLAAWVAVAVTLLPSAVNAIAYLADPGHQATFRPISCGQSCSRSGCHTVTQGVLGNGTLVTWPDQVPLGQTLTVRAPVWTWGAGNSLTDGAANAVAMTIWGLVLESAGVAAMIALVVAVRNALRWHRQPRGDLPAAMS
jgi:hypothetical protein